MFKKKTNIFNFPLHHFKFLIMTSETAADPSPHQPDVQPGRLHLHRRPIKTGLRSRRRFLAIGNYPLLHHGVLVLRFRSGGILQGAHRGGNDGEDGSEVRGGDFVFEWQERGTSPE